MAADKARKDEEEETKKEEEAKKDAAAKADASRADSLSAKIEEQSKAIAALTALIRTPIPDSLRKDLAEIQSRADSIHIKLGERAKEPMVGESPAQYARRMATNLQRLSKNWKDIKLDALDDSTFKVAE